MSQKPGNVFKLHAAQQSSHCECISEPVRTAICDSGTLADILHSFVDCLRERSRITSSAVPEWPLHRKPFALVDPLLHLVREERFQELRLFGPLLFLRLIRVDPQAISLREAARIEPDSIANS